MERGIRGRVSNPHVRIVDITLTDLCNKIWGWEVIPKNLREVEELALRQIESL
jgi:hypothetical protein